MNGLPDGWERYRLSTEEAQWRLSDFGEPVLRATKLVEGREIKELQATYKKAPGIYFWLMNVGSSEYKIYIGKTKSLSYRVANYIADFQPHSPNDFKLRVFEFFVGELVPSASMSLFFARKDVSEITDAENKALEKYKWPLLNQRAEPTPEAKAQLRDAFTTFYQSSFEAKLKA